MAKDENKQENMTAGDKEKEKFDRKEDKIKEKDKHNDSK